MRDQPGAAGCERTGGTLGSAPLSPVLRVMILASRCRLLNHSNLIPGILQSVRAWSVACSRSSYLQDTVPGIRNGATRGVATAANRSKLERQVRSAVSPSTGSERDLLAWRAL